jgi:hypothetical protein
MQSIGVDLATSVGQAKGQVSIGDKKTDVTAVSPAVTFEETLQLGAAERANILAG